MMSGTFFPYMIWNNHPPCKYNIIVVSHGIVELNKQDILCETVYLPQTCPFLLPTNAMALIFL